MNVFVPEGEEGSASEEWLGEHEATSVGGNEGEMEFLEVGPNGGVDPRVDRLGVERVIEGVGTWEAHLPDVAGPAEGEHAAHENGEASELFGLFIAVVELEGVVVEVEHLEMLP